MKKSQVEPTTEHAYKNMQKDTEWIQSLRHFHIAESSKTNPWFSIWLTIFNDSDTQNYHLYQKNDFNFPIFTFAVLIWLSVFFCRGSILAASTNSLGGWFTLAFYW